VSTGVVGAGGDGAAVLGSFLQNLPLGKAISARYTRGTHNWLYFLTRFVVASHDLAKTPGQVSEDRTVERKLQNLGSKLIAMLSP